MCGIFSIVTDTSSDAHKQVNFYKLGFDKIKHRGPDNTHHETFTIGDTNYFLGFHRLSIMGLDSISDQPMSDESNTIYLICNGEIYNWEFLRDKYGFEFKTHSDCEIIIHMYKRFGISGVLEQIQGEFVFMLVDKQLNEYFIARDPIGIRPLFYQHLSDNGIIISSEHKGLLANETVNIFPPGHIMYRTGNVQSYINYEPTNIIVPKTRSEIVTKIRTMFLDAVHSMIKSDRPMGAFLSGGLDSSVVCSIAAKYYKLEYPDRKLNMFSIGMKGGNSPDLIAAKKVYKYLDELYGNVVHHVVEYTPEEAFEQLEDLIQQLETYDITTIRASMPMYLLSKYINQNTDIKTMLSGEGSDEIFGGYAYFGLAPDNTAFEDECRYLVHYLHQYDVLRSDRSTSRWGLEVRVPFLEVNFCRFVLNIPGEFKKHTNELMEKAILRESLEEYLPHELLWRRKEAFSDAVGYSWMDLLKAECSRRIAELCETNSSIPKYKTDEETYYKYVYNKYYPGRSRLIDHIWRPNPKWTDVEEPSAQFLKQSVSSSRLNI